ncbi:MAG: PAS domain S-box protein [Phycisphaeraceae bacterium]|nr:PAS domain S-box protein [Phycisphaeraceae bacterium]
MTRRKNATSDRGYLARLSDRLLLTNWPVMTVLIVLTAGGLGTLSVYLSAHQAYRDRLQQHMLDQVRAAASLIDGDAHEQLTRNGTQDSPEYAALVDPLVRLKGSQPNIRFLYTFYRDPGGGYLRFALDATPPGTFDEDGVEQHSYLGDIYELDDLRDPMYLILEDGVSRICLEAYEDDWGIFVSAYAPIRNSAGNVVAAVGLDLDLSEYLSQVRTIQWAALIAGVPILVIGGLFGWLAARWQKQRLAASLLVESQEAEIVRQRLLLKAALAGRTELICRCYPDGRLFEANGVFLSLFGLSEEELRGREFQALVDVGDGAELVGALGQAVESGAESRFEQRMAGPDGSVRHILWRITRSDESITEPSLLCFGWDVTRERQALQKQLLLQQAIEQTPASVVITDREGTIQYVNHAFVRTTGYSETEAIGSNPRILKSGEQDTEFYAALWTTILTGSTWTGELVNRKKNGQLYWERAVISPVADEDGTVSHYVAVKEDITASILAERELRESRRRLEVATRGNGIGIWEVEFATEQLTWDDRMFELYDVDPTDFTGRLEDWRRCVLPEDLESTEAHYRQCAIAGQDFDIDFRIRRRDGSIRHLAGSAVVTHDDSGKPLRITGVNFDITERKRSEAELAKARDEAESANRAKTQFLANMSHEIRTPMTAILGFTDLLLKSSDQPEVVDHLQVIRRNGQHLLQLINDILDLSKIEAGKMEVKRQPCRLYELVAEVASLMHARARSKGLSFRFEFPGDVPRTITTDPLRMRQILINLTGNAIKFTDHGEVRLIVKWNKADGPGQVCFDVIDTGAGIDPDRTRLLFQPFTQVDSSSARRFSGTGLGLAISRQLTELLGGELTLVDSKLGEGSCFRVSLPLTAADEACILSGDQSARRVRTLDHEAMEPPSDGVTAVAAPEATELAGRRILLAEDGPDNQRLISFLLEHRGAEVDVAENGQEAIERLERAEREGRPFDLVLMDMQMPIKDGYSAARELRARRSTVPIIALTAHAMSGDRDKCLAAGCDDYATKPIEKDKLFGVINRCLASAREAA